MPSTNNRALLVELTVFLAENNIRRGVAKFAVNAQASDSAYQEESRNLAPLGAYTYTCIDPNAMTILRASRPVSVTITKGADVWETFNVNSIFVFSDSFTSMVVTNLSATDSTNLTLLQV